MQVPFWVAVGKMLDEVAAKVIFPNVHWFVVSQASQYRVVLVLLAVKRRNLVIEPKLKAGTKVYGQPSWVVKGFGCH
jgi:hypothetical protein